MPITLNSLNTFTSALGYGPDEIIFFRLITAKNFNLANEAHVKLLPGVTYIRDGKLCERKTNLTWNQSTGEVLGYGGKVKSTDITSYLQSQSDLGMAIYIVVNPGGQSIPEITEARVIYYENDEHSIPDQIAKFNELNDRWGGGFAVKTRHSIHSYFRLESPVTPSEFTEVQKRIIAYLPGSDKCIHDASRVMRVPGFDHIQIDNNIVTRTPIEIIHDWDGTYTNWQQIDSDLPQLPKTEIKTNNKVTLEQTPMIAPNPDNYPSLTAFISVQNREYIKHGAALGSRNTVAKTLASDLIGTARQLESMCIPVSDSADDLYLQYCDHCDTAQPGELEGIWEKTLKENPTPCLDTDKIHTNLKAHYVRTFKDGVKGFGTNTTPSYYDNRSNGLSILAQELEYIDAKDISIPVYKTDRASQLWIKIKGRYPADVVKSIEANTRRLGVREYVYAMAYDAVVSGMCNGKYSVKSDSTWNEPLNIFVCITGIPGVNKSHIIKWLTSFLAEKNEEYKADHKAAKKQYTRDYAEYLLRLKQDPNDPENVEPDEPELKYASHGKTTYAKFIQALGTQKNSFNSASNLLTADEATTIFGGDEKTGVNVAELSLYLTGFTGGESKSNTKCDGVQGVSKTMFSILTTTQPVTLQALVKNLSKSNGFMERFLTPIINESDIKKYDWLATEDPIRPMGSHLEDIYNKFDSLDPDNIITISRAARAVLMDVEDWIFDEKSLRAKPKSYIIRLAGLYAVYDDYKNPVIQPEHVLSAWEMMKMDEANKTQLGLNKGSESVSEELVNKAVEILLSKGCLSAGKMGGQIYALRTTPISERQLVIDKVAQIMGNKVKVETSTNGKPVLVLNLDYVPTIEPEPIEIVTSIQSVDETSTEVDETHLDTVQLKGSQILPITEEPEAIEPTLEDTLTQNYEEQVTQTQIEPTNTDTIYIPYENLTETQQLKANSNNVYQVTRRSTTGVFIKLNDDSMVVIPNSQLETQTQDET